MLIGHRVDAVAGSRYSATIMGRHVSVPALLIALLVIAGMGMLYALSPTSISGQAGDPDDQREAVDDIRLAVKLEQSVREASPGEKVEYTATIENRTSNPQSNLSVQIAVGGGKDTLSYVPNSTFVRRSEGGPFVPLEPPLFRRPINVVETLASRQVVSIKWSMRVGECTLRNRWVQVGVTALTDETERASAEAHTYIAPHADLLAATKPFLAAHRTDSPPVSGGAVRHTISIVNVGVLPLDDLLVNLEPHETHDFLSAVSENASYYVTGESTEAGPRRSVQLGPGAFDLKAGFRPDDHLNPGEVLVLSWTDHVASSTPAGARIKWTFWVRDERVTGHTYQIGLSALVSPPHTNAISISIGPNDPRYFSRTYSPGDLVEMRVTVANRTETPHDSVNVTLDLPSAVSYVPGSGSYSTTTSAPYYSTATHVGPNSRRLPDNWIDLGAALPTIEPGNATTITFDLWVHDNVPPQSDLHVYATLRSSGETGSWTSTRMTIAATSDLEITFGPLEPVEAGGQMWFDVDVRNSGSTRITNAKFGVEETCAAAYVPGSLWVESREWVLRDDLSVLEQLSRNEDISVALGDLDPGDTVNVRMRVQVIDDIEPGAVVGPRFVIAGQRPGNTSASLLPVAYARQAEIVVAQPEVVTVEDFETAVRGILDRIETVTSQTKDTTERNKERAEAILGEVRNANPWGLGWKWVLLWGGFGALASFIAGLVLPFTLWRALAWLRERRWRRKNPYLAPATPPVWRSPSQWWAVAGRASEPLAAALRRVRDWVDGLRRR